MVGLNGLSMMMDYFQITLYATIISLSSIELNFTMQEYMSVTEKVNLYIVGLRTAYFFILGLH